MIYIGVDPGKNGGIAVIDIRPEFVNPFVKAYCYSDEELISLCSDFKDFRVVCFLEQVHAMPKQGVSSTFKFGQNYGYIMGVLEAFDIAYELVPPQKWKREFSCTADKNTSIAVAQRLFPDIDLRATERCKKPHDGKAESLLMAEYARRHMK